MGQGRHGSATIEPARRHRSEPAGQGTPSGQPYGDRKPGSRSWAGSWGSTPSARRSSAAASASFTSTSRRCKPLRSGADQKTVRVRANAIDPGDQLICEVVFPDEWLFLFVGIDRTAKVAIAQRVETADRKTARQVLQHLLDAVPCQVHTRLTDRTIGTPLVRETMARGIRFAKQPRNRNTIHSRPKRFDRICEANGIEHRLTKPPPLEP